MISKVNTPGASIVFILSDDTDETWSIRSCPEPIVQRIGCCCRCNRPPGTSREQASVSAMYIYVYVQHVFVFPTFILGYLQSHNNTFRLPVDVDIPGIVIACCSTTENNPADFRAVH